VGEEAKRRAIRDGKCPLLSKRSQLPQKASFSRLQSVQLHKPSVKAEEEEEGSVSWYTDLSEKDKQQSSRNKQCGFSDLRKLLGVTVLPHIYYQCIQSRFAHLQPNMAQGQPDQKTHPTNKQTKRHGSISTCSHPNWPTQALFRVYRY